MSMFRRSFLPNAKRVTCRGWTELVTDYIEGHLPEATVRKIDRHLGRCKACRAYLDQMRTTIRTVGALARHDVTDAMPEQLRAALLAVYREGDVPR